MLAHDGARAEAHARGRSKKAGRYGGGRGLKKRGPQAMWAAERVERKVQPARGSGKNNQQMGSPVNGKRKKAELGPAWKPPRPAKATVEEKKGGVKSKSGNKKLQLNDRRAVKGRGWQNDDRQRKGVA